VRELSSLNERIVGWKNLKMSEIEKQTSQEVLNRLKSAEKLIETLKNDIVPLAWRVRAIKRLGSERLPSLATTSVNAATRTLIQPLIEMGPLLDQIVLGVVALEQLLATPALTVENS
jgi:hypothetical protein